MPFVQRVVQPVNLAQVCGSSTSGSRTNKFLCVPGKCKNNNCINNKPATATQQLSTSSSQQQLLREASLNVKTQTEAETTALSSRLLQQNSGLKSPSSTSTSASSTTTITTAIIHNSNANKENNSKDTTDNANTSNVLSHPNGFTSSFPYNNDDHDDDDGVITPVSPAPSMPMKKLKQHVEFLSTVPSPTRSHPSRPSTATGGTGTLRSSSSSSANRQRLLSPQTPQTPTAAKIVAGYEFDSISNITLSNALRQLASLVLIASDIFDDLQRELQMVGDRARVVQKKIVAVERRVSAYDPKTVTVPESDLLTFAQRKQHYDCDKSFVKELFTADTRPRSVRVLYEDAGKVTPPPPPLPSSATILNTAAAHTSSSASGSPIQFASGHVLGDGSTTNNDDMTSTGGGIGGINHYHMAAGCDDLLLCTMDDVFGINTKLKMRTRIDAEIEIRLPAAIEELRKWTSSEALGDVTVTPDCMHHVDTSISTSMCIGDNGILTPALSPSVLSADAVDALYSINISNTVDNSQIPNDINKDVPLNHRLPSPEEQCKIIALRYPAEVISVDTSGKRFQRMCMARKSTTGVFTHMPETNNLNEDVQTVSRRSRSRKARGKRRNTIAGIDQKEIRDAANGDTTATSGELKTALASTGDGNGDEQQQLQQVQQRNRSEMKSKKFGRSKSSDILKKESVALPYDKGKTTLTRLNSLKQWGRNRFKFMQRNNAEFPQHQHYPQQQQQQQQHQQQQYSFTLSTINSSGCSNDLNTSGTSSHNSSTEKAEICSASGSASGSSHKTASTAKIGEKSGTDVDEDCRVHDMIAPHANETRFSHERKPSYSSSEKSMSVSSSGHLRGKLHLNSACANVKLRDTSSLNRQRRINGLGSKDDQPHSSSGNWSASSESGRASIGSEITLQPKSSASNTSLNVSSFHNGSAPPSSMLSRRRFFNTSASSSVTSEGTATPDLQINGNNMEGSYPNHLDDETSSAYSCDTEGYYTSFHMDSGLRTLKEEEINMSNFQIGGQPFNSAFGQAQLTYNNSQQTLMAENEYELFGRGSTSTTTSSAGTVCTTLMAHNSGTEQSSLNNSLVSCGPEVPERISSLRHSTASTSTLERSISSSTIGSTLERTGTIKRNVNASLKLVTCTDDLSDNMQDVNTPESQDDEFNYGEQSNKRQALPLPQSSANEIEYSECSDLEGVERIERMRQKTALNAKRIPSMCIITPSTSDDENQTQDEHDIEETICDDDDDELNKTLTEDSFKDLTDIEEDEKLSLQEVDDNLNHVKPSTNMSLMKKLKVVLPNIKKSPSKALPSQDLSVINDDELYDTAGEYVYISADVSNNNKKALQSALNMPKASVNTGLSIYYSNSAVVNRAPKATEYVSLNELPKAIQKAYAKESLKESTKSEKGSFNRELKLQEQRNRQGAESEFIEETKEQKQQQQQLKQQQQQQNMYAEINELRTEIAASAALTSMNGGTSSLTYLPNTPPSSANSSPHVSPHKGARVRLNAQGKPIYDSDSLKRRKGAHTTFAPGPYVKRHLDREVENESIDVNAIRNTTTTSESNVNPVAKLLLLSKVNATNPRKIANVRPIINKSQIQRPLPSTPVEQQQQQQQLQLQPNTANNEMSGFYMTSQYAVYNKDGNKHSMANGLNPYFHQQSSMHSPSTKSTASSTGSTISSSTASSSAQSSTASSTTNTTTTQSGGGTSAKDDEGYQLLHKTPDEVDSYYETLTQKPLDHNMAFQRNTPVYWTLQNRRPAKPQNQVSAISRDDLYATPIKRSERLARAQQQQQQQQQQQLQDQQQQQQQHLYSVVNKANSSSSLNTTASLSPLVQRNRTSFMCSTPIRAGHNSDSQLPADNIPAKQPTSRIRNWDDNSPERLNTCADRIGQSKTSLMDFKKLLLAKSAKCSTVPKKISAVELLKKSNASLQSPLKSNNSQNVNSSANPQTNSGSAPSTAQLNSGLKLLDLSGSPKTFANRRMLRQGQFGSPSKTFGPKMKASPTNWRSNSVQRTDIMSTTIPEANSEEDQSGNSSHNSSTKSSHSEKAASHESLVDTDSLNLKHNIFLQTEENNFMRGELRSSFTRSKNDANKYVTAPMSPLRPTPMIASSAAVTTVANTTAPATAPAAAAAVASMPALETAL